MTRTTGRKPKITLALQERICDAIRAGNYLEAAAEHSGIGKSTFFRWMAKGEAATTGPYRVFWEAVKKAESDSEVVLVAHWRKAAAKNWVAAAALLERRFRSRWSRSEHVKLEANVTTNMDDELLAKLGRLVAGGGDAGQAVKVRVAEPAGADEEPDPDTVAASAVTAVTEIDRGVGEG